MFIATCGDMTKMPLLAIIYSNIPSVILNQIKFKLIYLLLYIILAE